MSVELKPLWNDPRIRALDNGQGGNIPLQMHLLVVDYLRHHPEHRGHFDRNLILKVRKRPRLVASVPTKLVEAGLWEVDGAGWRIVGWPGAQQDPVELGPTDRGNRHERMLLKRKATG